MTRQRALDDGGVHPLTLTGAITLRELGREDRDVVAEVFDGLSPESRHLRFHTPVPALRASMLDHLSDLDGHRHVALAAETRIAGRARPIGLARYYRLAPGHAEIAFEVVDAWQGRGVGHLLLVALADHARLRGVETLVADVVGENRAALRLLRSALTEVRTEARSGRIHVLASSWTRDVLPLPAAAG